MIPLSRRQTVGGSITDTKAASLGRLDGAHGFTNTAERAVRHRALRTMSLGRVETSFFPESPYQRSLISSFRSQLSTNGSPLSPISMDSLIPIEKPSIPCPRPRILVPERISKDGLALLMPHFDVDCILDLSAGDLLKRIHEYYGLIIRSETKVTAEVLRAAKSLKVVARAGVGVDNIDVPTATSMGIMVVNSPAGNIAAAAEHTMALLLATARNIGLADASLKAGKWDRSKLVGIEVGRKILGIVGLGKVGTKVARMAKGMGIKVLAVDPYASADIARHESIEMVSTLAEMLPVIDFLTIHTPLMASTLNLIGETELRLMKKTSRVLNVARGGIYNEEALLKALDEGWITGAGMDVFTSEPVEAGSAASKLARHPKVVATPHLGASTVEAQENVSLDVCRQVMEILQGGFPTSAINAPIILPEEYRKLQPSVQLVEKMGRLYTQHFVGGKGRMVGGRKFELIYHGDVSCMPNTKPLFAALVKGLVSSFSEINVNVVNATLIAREKGIVIDETRASSSSEADEKPLWANLVTMRAHHSSSSSWDGGVEQVIEGYTYGERAYISKLDRFRAGFLAEGTLIILHNYDRPGKIGGVGTVLGKHGINIKFMQVGSVDVIVPGPGLVTGTAAGRCGVKEEFGTTSSMNGRRKGEGEKEALMILGVEGDLNSRVMDDLNMSDGVLDVSVVVL